MVENIQEYPWSSYHHNALGYVEQRITEHQLYLELGTTKKERAARYKLMIDKMALENENQKLLMLLWGRSIRK